jgi:hypothetical protein
MKDWRGISEKAREFNSIKAYATYDKYVLRFSIIILLILTHYTQHTPVCFTIFKI